MLLQVDLTDIPEHLWLIGAIATTLGGLCIKMYVTVKRLSVRDKEREKEEKDRAVRDQAVWDAWRVEAEGRRQQLQALNQQVIELQSQNSKLHETILDLHTKLSAAHIENAVIRVSVADLQKHNTELQGQVADLFRGQHGNS